MISKKKKNFAPAADILALLDNQVLRSRILWTQVKYVVLLSKVIFVGSAYPTSTLYDFENKKELRTACRNSCTATQPGSAIQNPVDWHIVTECQVWRALSNLHSRVPRLDATLIPALYASNELRAVPLA